MQQLTIQKTLNETLSFFGIKCNDPYFISSGKRILKYPEKAFRIDFYAFCICISGSIEIEIDLQKHHIKNNSFLILSPTTYIKFSNVSKNFKMKVLFFEKNFLLKNISNPFIIEKMNLFRNKSYSIVKSCNNKKLLNLLNELKEKTKLQSSLKKEVIRAIIFNLLLEIALILENFYPKKNIKPNIYLQFKELVQANILTNHSVLFYAEKLCISRKYLIEIVKKSSGKTPHEIIDDFLLKEALVLLNNPTLTISQISELLSFNSSSAFGRFFKKHTFISPSEYRKKENLNL